MTLGTEEKTLSILDLPEDVSYLLLSYCDLQSLGRLAQVCRRFHFLVNRDLVWVWMRRRLTLVRDYGKASRYPDDLPIKEQCRIATNWARGRCRDQRIIHHRVRQLPWLQLDNETMWVSYKNIIRCYYKKQNGHLQEMSQKTLRGHRGDVTKFVVRDRQVVSGSRDGSISSFCSASGQLLRQLRHCHSSDIHSVDCQGDVVVSGSRDNTVKVWNLSAREGENALSHTIQAHDRVWSVALDPTGRSFAVGTAGIHHLQPLGLWETERAEFLGALGSGYKYGAGVLDIQYEAPDILLTCGYDTYIRLWDTRASYAKCVMIWEEPYDSTIYCVRSDNQQTFVSGTARHGMTRLWDKRSRQHVQCYYFGKSSSPVYSLAFDPKHLYVALDKGINLVDFSIK